MSKKKTTEQFIIEAMNIHGDKFDYSETVYVTSRDKVTIICKQHGNFKTQAFKHLSGKGGCKKCQYIFLSDVLKKHEKDKKPKKSMSEYHHENKHRESYKIVKRRYANKRYAQIKDDPMFKLRRSVRSMLNRTLRKIGVKKMRKTETMLGYSVDEFRLHMESRFLDGMSWENHGAWHIDHIIPLVAFIRAGITDAGIVNALNNLQPLWAKDNFNKSERDVLEIESNTIKAKEFAMRFCEVGRLTINPEMVPNDYAGNQYSDSLANRSSNPHRNGTYDYRA